MIELAFYHGPGDWTDRVIRRVTGSIYSHVELVDLRAGTEGRAVLAVSASWRDGGVRSKRIVMDPARWHCVALPWASGDTAAARAIGQVGRAYDLKGVLLTHWLRANREDRNRWFCSELVAWALGLTNPAALSPGGLFDRITDMNRAHAAGRQGAACN